MRPSANCSKIAFLYSQAKLSEYVKFHATMMLLQYYSKFQNPEGDGSFSPVLQRASLKVLQPGKTPTNIRSGRQFNLREQQLQ